MTDIQMQKVIEETASALAVEGFVMTAEERENLKKVARKELSYDDLVAQYAEKAKQLGVAYA